MNNYQNYHIEDFVLDAYFQRFVRYGSEEHTQFWAEFRQNNPDKVQDIVAAEILLRGVYGQQTALASEEEIQTEIASLISRIQADRLQPETVLEEDPVTEAKTLGIKWWLAAASVALICTVAAWNFLRVEKEEFGVAHFEGQTVIEKSNNGSANESVTLADGSVIELRPGSSVRYAEGFEGNIREVSLSGEALFRVAKDAKRPFVVYANDLVTRVLGTTFLVRSVKGAKESSVEVTEGKVSVYRQKDFDISKGAESLSKGIILTANQKIVFQKDENVMTKSLVDMPAIVPAVKPLFVYRNAPVSEILKDIEKAYEVDISFDEEQLKNCTVTATLGNQSLLEKIEIVCETVEAKYEVLDGQIIVYGKNCAE